MVPACVGRLVLTRVCHTAQTDGGCGETNIEGARRALTEPLPSLTVRGGECLVAMCVSMKISFR